LVVDEVRCCQFGLVVDEVRCCQFDLVVDEVRCYWQLDLIDKLDELYF